MTESPAVDVENLHKIYRDGLLGRRNIDALRGVTFGVSRGEIFGLLGPNGAGKTTLIKVLLGIVRSSGGKASLLGRPAGNRLGRKRVGYLPENHRIPRHHTGNSALAFFGSLSDMPRREIRRRRPALLDAVGLADWGNTSIKKYSKGMLQRLGLAQALLHDPELLILDEPTDGVDPVGRSEMRTLLQDLKAQGKTIFINSHLLQELELVCDRVAILDRGKLLHEGPISQLTTRADADVQMIVGGTESALRAALSGDSLAEVRTVGVDQFEVLLKTNDQAVVDGAIDRLRDHGISVVSMSRGRQTLEEAFLEILERSRKNS
ncbi:MAG TPA: ABC transporter ATP-binding protein [Pirellulales bacterium]|jgi:ABC-2 type transport system ATP-binding protein|nr:ABC transporter ATP-binding protein [Pirellulales bacterium]